MYELFVSGDMGIQNWSGSLSVSSGLVGYKGYDVANGVPLLDSNGKIQVSQLPNSVMEYKGTWNVATNTPYLVNGVGNAGDVYIVTGAATGGTTHDFGAGPILFYNGDQAIYDGSAWQRASGSSGTVTSVAMSVPTGLSVTGSPITTSGTLAVSLASGYTIPTTAFLSGLVPYTGATQTLDMGAYDVNARGIKINGTGGLGHIDYKHQSGTPTGSASSSTLFANVDGDLSWLNDHSHIMTLSAHANTADRVYTFPDASGTLALTSDLSSYVPYTGATNDVNLGTHALSANASTITNDALFKAGIAIKKVGFVLPSSIGGYIYVYSPVSGKGVSFMDGADSYSTNFLFTSTTDRTFTFPDASGTIALTSNLNAYVPYTGATSNVVLGTNNLTANTLFTSGTSDAGLWMTQNSVVTGGEDSTTYTSIKAYTNRYLYFSFGYPTSYKRFRIDANGLTNATTRTYIMPDKDGTFALTNDINYPVTSVFGRTGAVTAQSGDYTTTQVTEGTNLYYTDARARASLSFTAGSGAYNSTTGVITIPTNNNQITNGANYITLTSLSATSPLLYNNTTGVFSIQVANGSQNGYLSSTDWTTFNSKQSALTFTAPLVNTSGTITITQATTSTNGYLSSTDWNTFNNKQNALTNPVTGTGTNGYHAKFTGTSTIGNSIIYDNGSNVGINTSSPISLGAGNTTLDIRSTSGSSLYLGTSSTGTLRLFADGTNAYVDNLIDTGAIIFRMTSTPNEAMRIASSRNVLIGTSTDAGYKLDVNGTGRFSGVITVGAGTSKFGDIQAYNSLQLTSGGVGGTVTGWIWNYNGYLDLGISTLGSSNIALSFNSSKAATFSSSVTANGDLTLNGNRTIYLTNPSTAAGSLVFYNSTSSAIKAGVGSYYNVADEGDLEFLAGGTSTKMIIRSSGNVGIGTTSPSEKLHIYGTSTNTQTIRQESSASAANAYLVSASASKSYVTGLSTDFSNSYIIYDATASALRMCITSAGNVGIGTTSPSGKLHVFGNTYARYGTDDMFAFYYDDTYRFGIKNPSSDVRSLRVFGQAADGNSFIVFATGNDTERMRITSGGNVGIGTTSPSYKLVVSAASGSYVFNSDNSNNASGTLNALFTMGSNANNTSSYHLVCSLSSGDRMYIYGNGNIVNTNGSYGTLSDVRLKENIVDATLKLDDILKLKVRNFNLIGDENKQIGFIAQEFEEVFPKMIDIDGKTGMKTIKTSVLVPMLVKAIQEQQAQIEELKSKIN